MKFEYLTIFSFNFNKKSTLFLVPSASICISFSSIRKQIYAMGCEEWNDKLSIFEDYNCLEKKNCNSEVDNNKESEISFPKIISRLQGIAKKQENLASENLSIDKHLTRKYDTK